MQIRNTMFVLSGLKPLSISYKYNFILVAYSNVQLVTQESDNSVYDKNL